ncbi:hypothetical protein O181_078569 [Austropuccinia psidii MF-1]|uniref:Uncharacterized protein n=1 Tax=Austropuccinia psidii MF-1 TaxID=1389203 RepID=A0A9Q3IHE7_9BASI|nr:hypothetical protein [Austropuccinia psidii MF-1]
MIVHIIKMISRQDTHGFVVPNIPLDLQTIRRSFKIKLELEQYVCCQRCYALYDIEVAPRYCDMKISVNSVPCGTKLFKISKLKPLSVINFTTKDPEVFRAPRQIGHICLSGQPCLRIPYTSFITQSLSDWLKWFINTPETENHIE